MSTSRGRWLAAVTAVIAAIIAAPAPAQTSELTEIVVTARKRDESLQNVPVTVDAFTAQTIKAAGIESPRDFVAMVPNMTMVEVQNVGNSFITVRGISQARNSEPSVAVLVDGVLEPNPYEFDQELFDIKQIEVLKGPQGALYGRNAIGGAIIIHTADPSDHFEGDGKVGVGNGVSEKAQVAVSGPIDAAGTLEVSRFAQFLQHRRLSGEHLSRPQGRSVQGLFRPAAAVVEALRPMERGPAAIPRSRRHHRLLLHHSARRRGEPLQQLSSTPPNANDVTSPIQTNNLGIGHSRHHGCRAQARLQPGLRDVHGGLGLQPHQGDRHRRCLRFPAHQHVHRL